LCFVALVSCHFSLFCVLFGLLWYCGYGVCLFIHFVYVLHSRAVHSALVHAYTNTNQITNLSITFTIANPAMWQSPEALLTEDDDHLPFTLNRVVKCHD
jgi:hypothetical protein